MCCCIYKATNMINGKMYIGATINLHRRKIEHKNHAKKDGGFFHDDIIKYGFDSFSWDILELCNEENLYEREIYYTSLYKMNYGDMCYNICKGGVGGKTHDVSGKNNPMYGRKIDNVGIQKPQLMYNHMCDKIEYYPSFASCIDKANCSAHTLKRGSISKSGYQLMTPVIKFGESIICPLIVFNEGVEAIESD